MPSCTVESVGLATLNWAKMVASVPDADAVNFQAVGWPFPKKSAVVPAVVRPSRTVPTSGDRNGRVDRDGHAGAGLRRERRPHFLATRDDGGLKLRGGRAKRDQERLRPQHRGRVRAVEELDDDDVA